MLIASGSISQTAAADLSAVRAYPSPYKPNSGDTNAGKPYSASDPVSGVVFDRLPLQATLNIFNVSGRLLRTLSGPDSAGVLRWDARDDAGIEVATGVYLVTIAAPGQKAVRRKVVIVR